MGFIGWIGLVFLAVGLVSVPVTFNQSILGTPTVSISSSIGGGGATTTTTSSGISILASTTIGPVSTSMTTTISSTSSSSTSSSITTSTSSATSSTSIATSSSASASSTSTTTTATTTTFVVTSTGSTTSYTKNGFVVAGYFQIDGQTVGQGGAFQTNDASITIKCFSTGGLPPNSCTFSATDPQGGVQTLTLNPNGDSTYGPVVYAFGAIGIYTMTGQLVAQGQAFTELSATAYYKTSPLGNLGIPLPLVSFGLIVSGIGFFIVDRRRGEGEQEG